MPIIQSPLRYPGGKTCLSGYFESLFHLNNLSGGDYAEAYCGGAGVAMALLLNGVVSTIHINDVDPAIGAFWRAVVNHGETLCDRILDTTLSVSEWDRQKKIINNRANKKYSDLTLGFATFYLNRLNRSGILNGGIIGGRDQCGPWKLDARFNRQELVGRIRRIYANSHRIKVYQMDAPLFLRKVAPKLASKGLVYLDPPYYKKGPTLYLNYYKPDDHSAIARHVKQLGVPWVVSYDNTPEVTALYARHRRLIYSLSYSALARAEGSEVMIFSKFLKLPKVQSPVSVGKRLRKISLNAA